MWKEIDNKLYKAFKFKDFSEAFSFITRVALVSERLNHHPTWTNTYNYVEIWLCSHDADNISTYKDKQLADIIDTFLYENDT